MKKFKIASGIVIASLTLAGALALAPVQTKTQPANAAEQTFDHSNCQYPDRWSNPVDGCDNSDPAVPECIKGATTQEAEATCIAAFVKAHEQPTQPTELSGNTGQLPAPTVNTCGGK